MIVKQCKFCEKHLPCRPESLLCMDCEILSDHLRHYGKTIGEANLNIYNFADFKYKRRAKQMRESGFTHHPVIRDGINREPFALIMEDEKRRAK